MRFSIVSNQSLLAAYLNGISDIQSPAIEAVEIPVYIGLETRHADSELFPYPLSFSSPFNSFAMSC